MTREEAITFMDELKVCIEEHPIVADWLVEIADRKTEPTVSKMEQVDKDINVRSKDCDTCKWWYLDENFGMTCMIFMNGDLPCHYEPKTEPQTERRK